MAYGSDREHDAAPQANGRYQITKAGALLIVMVLSFVAWQAFDAKYSQELTSALADSKSQIATIKRKLDAVEKENRSSIATAMEATDCAVTLEKVRRFQLMAITAQLSVFPAFKSDAYKEPIVEMKRLLNEFARPIELPYAAGTPTAKCATKGAAIG